MDNVVADCPAEDLVDGGAPQTTEPGRSDGAGQRPPADADGADQPAEQAPSGRSAATAAGEEAEVNARVVEFAVRASAPPPEALAEDSVADETMADETVADETVAVAAETGAQPDAADPAGPIEHAGAVAATTDATIEDPDRVVPAQEHPDREDATRPAAGRLSRRRSRRGPNKREMRHQQTREAIVDAAAALFSERGFDAVSVQQIARRAGVVEKTVFNHFPVKEGLVFEADPPMRAALLDAVRHRPAGESAVAAAGGFLVAAISQLGSPAAAAGVAEMARVVRGSRTLQVREREILGMLTDSLAEQIARETRPAAGDLQPWLAAHAALGLYTALLELARDRVLAGVSGPHLVAELRAQGERGVALLQFGLAGYAKRR